MWGASNLHWQHHPLLAPVAAAAQTFGKIVALWLLFKARPISSLRESVRYGLLVGLGFTVSEIILFYFKWAWGYVPASHFEWAFLIGVWERVSASMFHVYGTALVASSMWTGRRWLIGFVVGIHGFMDFLAFANLLNSVHLLEAIILACAVVTWVVFLLFEHGAKGRPGPNTLDQV